MNVRDWIYVIDHNKAVELVLDKGLAGEVYNVGANTEKPNIEIVKLVLKLLGKSESLIEYVKDRLGHDRRYSINSTKIKSELGWEAEHSFENAIQDTVNWYIQNEQWWKEIISGDYQNYYKLQYSSR
jgi:dTDP-glucose 4,6-dehydratase